MGSRAEQSIRTLTQACVNKVTVRNTNMGTEVCVGPAGECMRAEAAVQHAPWRP